MKRLALALVFVASMAQASGGKDFHIRSERVSPNESTGLVRYSIIAGHTGTYAVVTRDLPRTLWGEQTARPDNVPAHVRLAMLEEVKAAIEAKKREEQ